MFVFFIFNEVLRLRIRTLIFNVAVGKFLHRLANKNGDVCFEVFEAKPFSVSSLLESFYIQKSNLVYTVTIEYIINGYLKMEGKKRS